MRYFFTLSLLLFFTAVSAFCQINNRDTTFFISQSNDTFFIGMGGNLDAENTFSWDTVPNTYFVKFQPMVSLSITNNDTGLLKNPRLVINNRGRWFDLNGISSETTAGANTFTEKAKAIWEFSRNNRIHRFGVSPSQDWGNPVQLLGIYGFGICNNVSAMICELSVNERTYSDLYTNYGHANSEFKIGTDVGIIDADLETFYLKQDNQTLASRMDVSQDRNLIRRSTHYGKQYRFSDVANKLVAGLYRIEPLNTLYATFAMPFSPYSGQTLDFTLRPQESIVYDWADAQYHYTDWGDNALPSEMANGRFIYKTNFINAPLSVLLNGLANIVSGAGSPNIHSDTLAKSSFVVKITSPFTIVNGLLTGWFYKASANDSIEIFFSKDSINWFSKGFVSGTGNFTDSILLYNDIQPIYSGSPTFSYFLKFVFTPDTVPSGCGMDSLEIKTTFQVSRFFMPYLKLGNNVIEYTDQNNDFTDIALRIQWQESVANNPPAQIAAPVFPADGSAVDSLRFRFEWLPAADADGDTINQYEFQLSDMPDMKFPLSPVFNQYTNTKPFFAHAYWQKMDEPDSSRMNDALKNREIIPTYKTLEISLKEAAINNVTAVASPEFFIPENGLLNAGQTYYWRVRTRDSKGAWGQWSHIWSFTPNGTMPPVNPSVSVTKDSIYISWNKNPSGTLPAYYEIYSSKEWLGFTPDSSTLFDTTSSENFSFALPEDSAPDIFYRIIAVDGYGRRSGVSEVAQLPYPYYFGKPDTVKPDSAFSLVLNPSSLWFPYYNGTLNEGIATDTIKATFLYLPSWLTYDSLTNTISGNPDSAIAVHMLYDTLLSSIVLKLKGQSSFPHINPLGCTPPCINEIPSFQNTQIIRLNSLCSLAVQPLINVNADTLSISAAGISYQWYFQGNAIAGASQSTHIADSSGWYYVQVTLQGGCVIYSDTVMINLLPTFVHENNLQNTNSVWFDAADNSFTVRMSNSCTEKIRIRIFNLHGALVKNVGFSKTVSSRTFNIGMNGTADGVYILAIDCKDETPVRLKAIKLSEK